MATKLNYSVSLDGSTDAFSATDHADLKPTGAFTVGGWIKTSTVAWTGIFTSQADISSKYSGWNLMIEGVGGKGRIAINRNTGHVDGTDYKYVLTNTTLTDGNWHYVVGTWDGSYLRIYVDGILDCTPVAWTYAPGYNATNYVRVGCYSNDGSNTGFFLGNLKGVFLDNGNAWTQAQIATRMFADLTSFISTGAYYKLENSGDDELAGGHDLSDIGTPTYSSGAEDVPHTYYLDTDDNLTSMKFDGSNNALSITDHSDLKPTGSFTVGAWVKTTYSSASEKDFISSYSSGHGFKIGISSGKIFFYVTNGAHDAYPTTSTVTISDGNWHFIVMVINGTNVLVYVDGVLDSTTSYAYYPDYAGTNYVRVGCGNDSGTNNNFWSGNLKGIFLINGNAWDVDTIKSKMFSKLTSSETNVKLILNLDGVLTDSSGNSHDASLVDTPYFAPDVPFDARGARQSVNFNANSAVSIVDHADLKPTGSFTCGAWVKTSTTGSYAGIIQSYSEGGSPYTYRGFLLQLSQYPNANIVRFVIGDGTTTFRAVYSTGTITDGAWHFVVGTWDGTNAKICIDGNNDTNITTEGATPSYGATNYVRVGCQNIAGSDSEKFPGKLRNAFLVNGSAWDATKIASYLTKNIDPTETNLKLLLNLDNNYIDRSGNDHHGTPIATPTFTSIVPYDGSETAVDTDDERSAKITGYDTASSERGAKLTGLGVASERDATLTGKEETSDERGAKLSGGLEESSERGAKLHGGDTANSDRQGKVTGKDSTSDERSSKLYGKLVIPPPLNYRILVKNKDGELLGEFESFRNLKFGKTLNSYGTCSFNIPANDPKASSLISLRKNTIWIYEEKEGDLTLVWAGEQAMRDGNLDNQGNNWVTIYAYTWLEQLNNRFTVYERIFEYQDVGDIVQALIDETQADSYGDLGITIGTIEETSSREITFHNDSVMESIMNLSNMANGFDFEITDNKVFNLKPIIGEDKTQSIILEYGKNIDSLKITEDFTKPSNRAIVLGNAIGESDLQRIEVDDYTSQEEYGLREYKFSQMDEMELQSFTDIGNAVNRKYGNSLFKIDINLSKSSEFTVAEFGLGDDVTLIISSGLYNISESYRVFEWSVSYEDDNSVKLSIVLGNFTYVE